VLIFLEGSRKISNHFHCFPWFFTVDRWCWNTYFPWISSHWWWWQWWNCLFYSAL